MTMTESHTDPQIVSMIDNLRQLSVQVKQIDEELGTDVTSDTARKNAIAKGYIEQYGTEEHFQGFLAKVTEFFSKQSENPALLTALVYSLNDTVSKGFSKSVKTHLDAELAKLPKPEKSDDVSDERKTELAKAREKAVGIFKAQKEMLRFYDVLALPTDIEEPSARRGLIGPRGAKFTKTYQYSINGKVQELTDSDGDKSLASLSNLALQKWAKELNWKTKDIRDYIVSQLGATVNKETNEVELDDTWSVVLPAPHQDKTLTATKVVASAATVDESEDDDVPNVAESESGEDMFAQA